MTISGSRPFSLICAAMLTACQPTTGVINSTSTANVANTSANTANTSANYAPSTSSSIDAKEPDQYQATVKLSMQAMGDTQAASLPSVIANVARDGDDRAMEFTLPTNEKVVFLEKGDEHYLILPGRKQYAELNRESLGMDVRRMMTPAQIVSQVKAMPGMQLVGDESVNGRAVTKYRYVANANTNTQAGNINTESYVMIDKDTGLPIHSETVSQSTSGGSVQGYKGLRLVTEMTDIKNTADKATFDVPTNFQKIDAEQVKAQVNLIFQALSALIAQAAAQVQPANTAPAR